MNPLVRRAPGFSEAARTIRRCEQELDRQNRESATFSNLSLEDQLIDAYEEAGEKDWDGEGSISVDLKTLKLARDFVVSLPREYQTPEIAPEPDGHVSLEWYRSGRRLLTVSVNPDGRLHWAALLGSEDPRGSCEFLGDAPRTLLHILRRVCGG